MEGRRRFGGRRDGRPSKVRAPRRAPVRGAQRGPPLRLRRRPPPSEWVVAIATRARTRTRAQPARRRAPRAPPRPQRLPCAGRRPRTLRERRGGRWRGAQRHSVELPSRSSDTSRESRAPGRARRAPGRAPHSSPSGRWQRIGGWGCARQMKATRRARPRRRQWYRCCPCRRGCRCSRARSRRGAAPRRPAGAGRGADVARKRSARESSAREARPRSARRRGHSGREKSLHAASRATLRRGPPPQLPAAARPQRQWGWTPCWAPPRLPPGGAAKLRSAPSSCA